MPRSASSFSDAVMGQLVVGAAADDARGERGHHARRSASRPARTGTGCPVSPRPAPRRRATARTCGWRGADGVDRGRADVADDHLGPGLDEVVDEAVPDLADALDADGPAPQAWCCPRRARPPRACRAMTPTRGQHGGVTRAAVGGRPARRPAAFPGDDVHVPRARADVAGGDVAPAAVTATKPAVGAQQRFGLDLAPGRR